MAVNLLAPLAQFDARALAHAHDDAARVGYRLRRIDGLDERLAAWIDFHFAPSWWSSEAAAGSAWVAERDGAIAGFAAFNARGLRFPWLRGLATRPDVGIFGPYGVAPHVRGTGAGEPLLAAAMCGLAEAGYAHALIPAVSGASLIGMYERRTGGRVAEEVTYEVPRTPAIILASGAGTNARNVLERVAAGALPLDIAAVVSDRADAGVLAAASEHGVDTRTVVWERKRESRAAFDSRIIDAVAVHEPSLVLLLGWMHLLAPAFLTRFPETINLHPAFLPLDPAADAACAPDGTPIVALRGAHALRDAVATGAAWSGVTMHYVTEATDRGAVLVRTPVEVGDARSEDALRAKVRPAEFAAVAAAIRRWGFEHA